MGLWGIKTLTDPPSNSSELLSNLDTKLIVALRTCHDSIRALVQCGHFICFCSTASRLLLPTCVWLKIVWVVIWAMALPGVANKIAKNNPSSTKYHNVFEDMRTSSPGVSYVAYFFPAPVILLGRYRFSRTVLTLPSRAVATCNFNAESSGATGASLKRSMTSSFGSICFGSLIVAFLQALRAMRLAENGPQEGSALACVAECILGCLQSIMEYFNRWAYVYVGIYGYRIHTGWQRPYLSFFKQRGFDAIISDDLIDNVLGFAALELVRVMTHMRWRWRADCGDDRHFRVRNSTAFLAILGLVVGIGVAVTPLAVIHFSSVATIFVCFAGGDPAAFQYSHPEIVRAVGAGVASLPRDYGTSGILRV
ncbi:unnamed protein product [Peronospora belbahrii]|uniref:Choline transporter-like protein n=1 Tax=Peronospora belbahrii TaxID=622444 RepID=A0AAU9LN82_9STRA|nr:unnamed protein product [Peronospora belbahrii]